VVSRARDHAQLHGVHQGHRRLVCVPRKDCRPFQRLNLVSSPFKRIWLILSFVYGMFGGASWIRRSKISVFLRNRILRTFITLCFGRYRSSFSPS
jgi:hypothetical protein